MRNLKFELFYWLYRWLNDLALSCYNAYHAEIKKMTPEQRKRYLFK